jgi:hypothetical protein
MEHQEVRDDREVGDRQPAADQEDLGRQALEIPEGFGANVQRAASIAAGSPGFLWMLGPTIWW